MTPRAHIAGLDYVRAVMSIFVVLWHMNAAGQSLICSPTGYLQHRFTLSDFANFHLFLLPVPVFLLISNYLLALRPPDLPYLTRRLRRVLILATFWPPLYIIFRSGWTGLIQLFPPSWSALPVVLLSAGHTVYYFFVLLLASYLFTYVICRWRSRALAAGCALSALGLFLVPLISIRLNYFSLAAHWNPVNFLPLSFFAVALVRFQPAVASRRPFLAALFLLGAVSFAVLEWHLFPCTLFFQGQNFALPAYPRLSLVCSATAILILATAPRLISPPWVRFLAANALALYCLHPFLIAPLQHAAITLVGPGWEARYISIALNIIFCYALTLLLPVYLKDGVFR